jgi:hypothetical protein
LVDHHAHGILRTPPQTLDEFRGLFSESSDPRQWPHVVTAVTYHRAIAVLAAHLGCEPSEQAVYARRLAKGGSWYAHTRPGPQRCARDAVAPAEFAPGSL